MLTFKIIITKQDDGSFLAVAPSLHHCMSEWNTEDEALQNIQEAIAGVVETMQAHSIPIPKNQQHKEILLDYTPHAPTHFRSIFSSEMTYA